jgi:hypothetical protein
MDWSKLKRLALAPTNPMAFFDVFTGELPLLEELEISYRAIHRPEHADPQAWSRFLTSLSVLNAITARCDKVDFIDDQMQFRGKLLCHLGHRVQKLSIQALHDGLRAPFMSPYVMYNLPHFSLN